MSGGYATLPSAEQESSVGFRLRPWMVRVHRFIGLSLASFLVIIGLTGCVIAWFVPLDESINAHLWKVTPQASAPLPALQIRERLALADPDNHYYFIQFPDRPDQALAFYTEGAIDPASGAERPIRYDEVFANPYTGEYLGARMWGNFSFQREDLVTQLYFLHYSLVLPEELGEGFMGWVAAIFAVDCFVGLYLTLPLLARSQSASGRSRGFLQRWATSWTIKRDASSSRRVLDLHRALSLWVWILLLIVAVSGFAINLPTVYASGIEKILNYQDLYKDAPQLPRPLLEPAIGWQQALALGQRYMQEAALREGFEIERPTALIYQRDTGNYFYRVLSDRDVVPHGMTLVRLDATTGALNGVELPTGQRLGNTLTSWLKGLHMAGVGGTPWKIVVSLLGLVLTTLSITGVVLWWRKRCGRRVVQRRARFL